MRKPKINGGTIVKNAKLQTFENPAPNITMSNMKRPQKTNQSLQNRQREEPRKSIKTFENLRKSKRVNSLKISCNLNEEKCKSSKLENKLPNDRLMNPAIKANSVKCPEQANCVKVKTSLIPVLKKSSTVGANTKTLNKTSKSKLLKRPVRAIRTLSESNQPKNHEYNSKSSSKNVQPRKSGRFISSKQCELNEATYNLGKPDINSETFILISPSKKSVNENSNDIKINRNSISKNKSSENFENYTASSTKKVQNKSEKISLNTELNESISSIRTNDVHSVTFTLTSSSKETLNKSKKVIKSKSPLSEVNPSVNLIHPTSLSQEKTRRKSVRKNLSNISELNESIQNLKSHETRRKSERISNKISELNESICNLKSQSQKKAHCISEKIILNNNSKLNENVHKSHSLKTVTPIMKAKRRKNYLATISNRRNVKRKCVEQMELSVMISSTKKSRNENTSFLKQGKNSVSETKKPALEHDKSPQKEKESHIHSLNISGSNKSTCNILQSEKTVKSLTKVTRRKSRVKLKTKKNSKRKNMKQMAFVNSKTIPFKQSPMKTSDTSGLNDNPITEINQGEKLKDNIVSPLEKIHESQKSISSQKSLSSQNISTPKVSSEKVIKKITPKITNANRRNLPVDDLISVTPRILLEKIYKRRSILNFASPKKSSVEKKNRSRKTKGQSSKRNKIKDNPSKNSANKSVKTNEKKSEKQASRRHTVKDTSFITPQNSQRLSGQTIDKTKLSLGQTLNYNSSPDKLTNITVDDLNKYNMSLNDTYNFNGGRKHVMRVLSPCTPKIVRRSTNQARSQSLKKSKEKIPMKKPKCFDPKKKILGLEKVTLSKGSLKRKRQILRNLTESNEEYEDDIFESKRLKSFKATFQTTEDDSDEDIADLDMVTPKCGFILSPYVSKHSPFYKDCISSSELLEARKIAEEYIHKRNKRIRSGNKNVTNSSASNSVTNDESSNLFEKRTLDYAEAVNNILNIQKNTKKIIHNESEDEDPYFSDVSD